MFLLADWGFTLHKTWQNTKGGYTCSYNQPIEALRLCNSCIVNEHKTKDVQGPGPSNVNLSLFVCFSDVYQASYPFLLLTMYYVSFSLAHSKHLYVKLIQLCNTENLSYRYSFSPTQKCESYQYLSATQGHHRNFHS